LRSARRDTTRVKEEDHTGKRCPCDRNEMAGLTASETLMKLLLYTFFMFAAPLATYRVGQDVLLPAAHARYGWTALEDAGGRAVYAGVAAILAVNAVLVVYVVSAFAEENSFGGNGTGGANGAGAGGGGSRGRDDGKRD
jgi:hypothetical protein